MREIENVVEKAQGAEQDGGPAQFAAMPGGQLDEEMDDRPRSQPIRNVNVIGRHIAWRYVSVANRRSRFACAIGLKFCAGLGRSTYHP